MTRKRPCIMTSRALCALLLLMRPIHGFVVMPAVDRSRRFYPSTGDRLSSGLLVAQDPTAAASDSPVAANIDGPGAVAVRAPLRYIGPYPALALRFPQLATAAQRARNATGVTLDFVLDTAANTNTIQQPVAQELRLPVVGAALPGVGASGALRGGETFLLGEAQLDGLAATAGGNETFMTGLTASALPVASPAAAGLLSLAFLYSFDGVGFHWGSPAGNQGSGEPPSVTFYGRVPESVLTNLKKVAIQPIPVTQLPSVTVVVNGCEMPALLDTGSPVTVFNAQAARRAGIETVALDADASGNPLANMARRLQRAQAAARGDVLQIMGPSGPVDLVRSTSPLPISLPVAGASAGTATVDFAPCPVYVGDLPGLVALQGIMGVDASSPATVLGMDVLRQRPDMLLRARHHEVWF